MFQDFSRRLPNYSKKKISVFPKFFQSFPNVSQKLPKHLREIFTKIFEVSPRCLTNFRNIIILWVLYFQQFLWKFHIIPSKVTKTFVRNVFSIFSTFLGCNISPKFFHNFAKILEKLFFKFFLNIFKFSRQFFRNFYKISLKCPQNV